MKPVLQEEMELSEDAQALADELTDVQLAFAWHVLAGETQIEAYRLTHGEITDASASTGGSRFAAKTRDFVRAVRQQEWVSNWVSYSEQRSFLADVIRDDGEQMGIRLAAAKQNAEIAGFSERSTGDDVPAFDIFEVEV